MIVPLLALALVPTVYWDKGPDAAPQFKKAGIQQLSVPASDDAGLWSRAGIAVVPLDAARQKQFLKVPKPGVRYELGRAGPTQVPWVDSNGWRFERGLRQADYADLPTGAAPLAAAEAYMYDADALLHPQADDVDSLGAMLRFLGKLPQRQAPVRANIGVVDDGTPLVGEVLNLLTRRNLLYHVVQPPQGHEDLTVRLGSPDFPRDEAKNPYQFADHVRAKLTDDKRLVRIYNTTATIVRLTGDDQQVRLHLLNYTTMPVKDVRIRLLGRYGQSPLMLSNGGPGTMVDYYLDKEATEFTIPSLARYAVIDMKKVP